MVVALAAGATTFLSSCSDDEDFTTSRDATMAFSQDVVTFDTVLVGVPSSTERLLVYNHNSQGLRITNAKLQSGGTSGFKMNIDGQFGSSIDNLELPGNDSLFIFVEVNAGQQPQNTPTRISDAIVFTLESGIQQQVTLEAYGQNVQVMTAERITLDRTLDNSIPYLIYDSLVVDVAATLTITDGATLYFHNDANLIVNGKLTIAGTQQAPVVMRGDRLDKLFTYLPYDRLDSQWGGIRITSSCTGCNINYADVHSGGYGILCEAASGQLSITNSVIHNVAGEGLMLTDCQVLVANTQITNCKGNCVSIYGGTSDFYHCTIAQFYPWNSERGHALYVSNTKDEAEHIVQTANFYNCLVTGYADDEVFGNPGGQTLNLRFDSSVLLTNISDATYFTNCVADSKDQPRYKGTNFKTMDTHAYFYDFHLDEQSTARGKGAQSYADLYPTDRDGTPRSGTPDAGCYQFK